MAISVSANPSALTWSMFQPVGSIPGTSEEAKIGFQLAPYRVQYRRGANSHFHITATPIVVRPDPQNTLVLITANKTAALLKHEQGHYDLMLLVTRAFAQDMDGFEAASVPELEKKMQDSHTQHAQRLKDLEHAYDTQTEHSRKTDMQDKWDSAIQAALGTPHASVVMLLPL